MKITIELNYEDPVSYPEIGTALGHLSQIISRDREQRLEGSGMDVGTGSEFTWKVSTSSPKQKDIN